MPSAVERNNVTITGNRHAERTLLFVHGFGTDQTAWQMIVPAFATDHRIVLLDNMGSGGSDQRQFFQHDYLNLNGYVRDLLAVCDELELREAVLVGHSVGAMIGVLAAIERPRHFARLALIGASPRYLDDAHYRGGFTEEDLSALYRNVTLQYTEWADQFAAAAMGNPERPQLAAHFASTIKTMKTSHALTALCAIFQSDHRQDIARLQLPTLLIQSREDVAVPMEVAEYMHRHIAGSRLQIIGATGHLPHISAPDEVIAALRTFIDPAPVAGVA